MCTDGSTAPDIDYEGMKLENNINLTAVRSGDYNCTL